jgi:hypothetical protein
VGFFLKEERSVRFEINYELCSCRTFQCVVNFLSDAKFQEIWCNVYITVRYFCKTVSWPSSVQISSTKWCTERCQKWGSFFRLHCAARFAVNVLCYLFRVIYLFIQNESVELTDDVKKSSEVLGCLLFSLQFSSLFRRPPNVLNCLCWKWR